MAEDHLKLVLKHRLLSASEAKSASTRLKTPIEMFPKILESDPQAQALKANIGDLIEIDREDPTGSYKYYRRVVKG